jgi:hypothetical protein
VVHYIAAASVIFPTVASEAIDPGRPREVLRVQNRVALNLKAHYVRALTLINQTAYPSKAAN